MKEDGEVMVYFTVFFTSEENDEVMVFVTVFSTSEENDEVMVFFTENTQFWLSLNKVPISTCKKFLHEIIFQTVLPLRKETFQKMKK